MSGQKEVSSAYALSIIEEGLKDIVPFKITTFAAWDGIEHYTVRNWNDKSKEITHITFYITEVLWEAMKMDIVLESLQRNY